MSSKREYMQAYYRAHPEKWEGYYPRNRDRILKRNKEKYAANPEKARAAAKKWRDANPDKMKAYHRKVQELVRWARAAKELGLIPNMEKENDGA